MWTSCVAINTWVWTTEGTLIPWSVNIFCLKLLFLIWNTLFLPKYYTHQQTFLSPVLFVVVHFCKINIANLIQEVVCLSLTNPSWQHIFFAKWRQITNKKRMSKDVQWATFGIKVGKETLCVWVVKRKRPLQCLCKAPFKNILKIIALFFAKMIIYSTRTKLPAIQGVN